MSQSTLTFDQRKDLLEKEWVELLLMAVETGELALLQMKPIANEVLYAFDDVENDEQVSKFINDIAKKWTFFQPLQKNKEKAELSQKEETSKSEEKQIIDKLSSYLKNQA